MSRSKLNMEVMRAPQELGPMVHVDGKEGWQLPTLVSTGYVDIEWK